MSGRALRRHQAISHMWRRLKEDRNQHYEDKSCPCWTDIKAMARMKEQPKKCSNPWCCGNPRRFKSDRRKTRLTVQELRAEQDIPGGLSHD